MTALVGSLLALLFIPPLLSANINYGYEQIKVLSFLILMSLSLLLWIGLYFHSPQKYQIKWTVVTKISSIFILILLLSSLLGINPKQSLVGDLTYLQGAIVYLYLFIFSLLVATIKPSFKAIQYTLISSALIISIEALAQWVGLVVFKLPIQTYAGRVVSSFGQPNLYSGFLLLVMPFVLSLKNKKFQIPISVLISVAILVSFSKTAIIILAGVLFFNLLAQLKGRLHQLAKRLFFAGLIIALTYSLFNQTGLLINEFGAVKGPRASFYNSPEQRLNIWPILLQEGLNRPILGSGLDTIDLVYPTYFQSFNFINGITKQPPEVYALQGLTVSRAHNYPLDLFIFAGLIGVVSWLFLIYFLFKSHPEPILFQILVIYLIWIQFQNQSIVHLIFFWLLVGLVQSGTLLTSHSKIHYADIE